MVKIINSPSKYIQGKNEITNLATYYKLRGNSGAYLLVDKFIFDNFKDSIFIVITHRLANKKLFNKIYNLNEVNHV